MQSYRKFIYNQKLKFQIINTLSHKESIPNKDFYITVRGIFFDDVKIAYLRINDVTSLSGRKGHLFIDNLVKCMKCLKKNYSNYKVYTSYEFWELPRKIRDLIREL